MPTPNFPLDHDAQRSNGLIRPGLVGQKAMADLGDVSAAVLPSKAHWGRCVGGFKQPVYQLPANRLHFALAGKS